MIPNLIKTSNVGVWVGIEPKTDFRCAEVARSPRLGKHGAATIRTEPFNRQSLEVHPRYEQLVVPRVGIVLQLEGGGRGRWSWITRAPHHRQAVGRRGRRAGVTR